MADAVRDVPVAGDPRSPDEALALLRFLYAIGRRDLPLGRLVEGHVDASQIVARYGGAAMAEAFARRTRAGGLLCGVWNAPHPDERLVLSDTSRLTGAKSFASGAAVLTHALVTADRPDGPQLVLVDLRAVPPAVDADWWNVVGMQRSQTYRVRWEDAPVAADDVVGRPGDYPREPWFSGGALRFAAVQAGGIACLFDHARNHLVSRGRADDPHQRGRLADLYGAARSAAAAVAHAASQWFDAADDAQRIAHVAAARVAVYEAGDVAITIAQRAVGVEGLFSAHPLAAAITDLMAYLRQPGPDAQRMAVGAAVASGVLEAGL